MQSYGNTQSRKHRKVRRAVTGIVIIILIVLAAAFAIGIIASDGDDYNKHVTAIEENHLLRARITELEEEIDALKAELEAREGNVSEQATATPQLTE